MPIQPAPNRATIKPKLPTAPPKQQDLTPLDRVSNCDAPASDTSDDDVDSMLARLGMTVEFVDPDERFAEWYEDVNKHLRAGSLADVWRVDGLEPYQKSPVNPSKTVALTQKQPTAKRKLGAAAAIAAPRAKRSRPTATAAVKAEAPAPKRPAVGKPTKPTATGKVATTKGTGGGKRGTAARATAVKHPVTAGRVQPAPTGKPTQPATSKPTTAVQPTAHRGMTAAAGKAEACTPPARPLRTRIFYPRRAKAAAEPEPVSTHGGGESSILTSPPPSLQPTTLPTAQRKVTRTTRSTKVSARRK